MASDTNISAVEWQRACTSGAMADWGIDIRHAVRMLRRSPRVYCQGRERDSLGNRRLHGNFLGGEQGAPGAPSLPRAASYGAIDDHLTEDRPRQIVGVVADLREAGLNLEPMLYVPVMHVPDGLNARNNGLLPITWWCARDRPCCPAQRCRMRSA